MGQTKKAKVMFTCEWEAKDYLTKWASAENRTVSNLCETLINEAIAARKTQETEKANEQPKQTSQLS